MYNDPKHNVSEILNSWNEKYKVDDKIKRLEKIDEIEKDFNKNINLDEYRNRDGSFNFYRVERSLDFKGGEAANSIVKKLHHEGFAFGNEKKMFFSDYGTNMEFLDVRFWDSKEEKEKWTTTKKIVSYNISNDDMKEILFGEESEEWDNHDNYKLIDHNCKKYVNAKFDKLCDLLFEHYY